MLPLSMGATEIQVIKGVSIPCLCCRNASGGQVWPTRWKKSPKSCMHCLQHVGSLSKVPLHPMVATAPMDLLHIDFTSIELTMKPNRLPKVTNVLVFQDHFNKHVMQYVTPNQTTKTITKFCIRVTSQSLGPWPGS